jgi:redox-sensitive bicupin YhaK (pirin superfamily)
MHESSCPRPCASESSTEFARGRSGHPGPSLERPDAEDDLTLGGPCGPIMGSSARPRSVRVAAGELDTSVVTTRRLLPIPAQPNWSPFHRVAESVANRARQLPRHAHEREEVLTYVTEGFASYQLESGATEFLERGSGRLLTAPGRVTHCISPAQGGAIRWFNLVMALPAGSSGGIRLQMMGPHTPTIEEDTVLVRTMVGPRAPMTSAAGLECEELQFRTEGTTFRKLGPGRRAVFYAMSGRGSVDQNAIEAGEVAFIEGMPGVAVHGDGGFSGILATAPGSP